MESIHVQLAHKACNVGMLEIGSERTTELFRGPYQE